MTRSDVHLERVRRLADAARRHQQAVADLVLTRDLAVLAAADAGHSHGTIAKVSGLHRSRIEQIIANTAARSAPHDGGSDHA